MVGQSLTEPSRAVKAPGTSQQPSQVEEKNPCFGRKIVPGGSFDKKLEMCWREERSWLWFMSSYSFYVCVGLSFLFSLSLEENCTLIIRFKVSQQRLPCHISIFPVVTSVI